MSPRELVAIRLPGDERFFEVLDDLWAAGHAVLPVDPALEGAALGRLLRTLRPARLIQETSSGLRTTDLPGSAPAGRDTALVVATSGTTAAPKGVELSHQAVRTSVSASIARLGCDEGDRWVACLPPHHVAGITPVLRSRAVGGRPIHYSRFDADLIATEVRGRWISLVPTMLARVLEREPALTRMKGVLLGGAPPPPELLRTARERGVRVVVSYGLTETCGGCIYDGVPLDGVDARVTRRGRLLLRGPMVMRGYRGDPEATGRTLREGWLVTSDLARVDDDGRIRVLGRLDDVIITGGENVVAPVVAEVTRRHPDVADAVVVGRPDAEWGQRVVAIVAVRPDAATPTLDEIRDLTGAHLPPAWRPREVVVVDDIPRSPVGKVMRSWIEGALAGG